MGILLSPIIYKFLIELLFPVSRPVTTLEFVLLKDKFYTVHSVNLAQLLYYRV